MTDNLTDPSKDWSPAEPLRADATDEQIIARYHAEYEPKKQLYQSFADIARELAAAFVAERDAELVRLRADAAQICEAYANESIARRITIGTVTEREMNATHEARADGAAECAARIRAARHSSEGTP